MSHKLCQNCSKVGHDANLKGRQCLDVYSGLNMFKLPYTPMYGSNVGLFKKLLDFHVRFGSLIHCSSWGAHPAGGSH